jgi:hypothetical protein
MSRHIPSSPNHSFLNCEPWCHLAADRLSHSTLFFYMVVEEEKEVKWHQDSVLVILERFFENHFYGCRNPTKEVTNWL